MLRDACGRICALINGKDALGDAFKPTLKPWRSEMPKEAQTSDVITLGPAFPGDSTAVLPVPPILPLTTEKKKKEKN